MFDFSFGEMLVVGLVALVVLGPERLPKAARFIGLWVRRARAHWHSVKHELEHELAGEELRRGLAESHQVMRSTAANLRATMTDSVAEVRAPVTDLGIAATEAPVEATEKPPTQDPHGS